MHLLDPHSCAMARGKRTITNSHSAVQSTVQCIMPPTFSQLVLWYSSVRSLHAKYEPPQDASFRSAQRYLLLVLYSDYTSTHVVYQFPIGRLCLYGHRLRYGHVTGQIHNLHMSSSGSLGKPYGLLRHHSITIVPRNWTSGGSAHLLHHFGEMKIMVVHYASTQYRVC